MLKFTVLRGIDQWIYAAVGVQQYNAELIEPIREVDTLADIAHNKKNYTGAPAHDESTAYEQ